MNYVVNLRGQNGGNEITFKLCRIKSKEVKLCFFATHTFITCYRLI